MINRIYILYFCLITVPFAMNGQTNSDDILDRMNELKQDESIIFGLGFHENMAKANNYAQLDLLSDAIEFRLNNNKVAKISIRDIQPYVKQLIYFDGSQYDVILYVGKDLILSLTGQTEDSVSSSNVGINSEPVLKEYGRQAQDLSTSQENPVEISFTPLPNNILHTLCIQDNWTEIKGFLENYKQQGKIKETGVCTTISEIPQDAYRVLIDEYYGILAMMAPKTSNDRLNIKSNQLDKESNYPNFKVIVWFK